MLCFRKRTIKDAYEYLVKKILNEGNEIIDEYGQKSKEIENVIIEITNPKDKSISEKYPFGENAVKKYTNNLLYGSENKFTYDYHSRLFKYKNINQIDYIIKKLQNEPNSRRGISITWNPFIDCDSNNNRKSVPCLQLIQFVIRNDKLNQTVVFRSNDALLAFHSNAIGLISLGEMIANELGIEYGKYLHHSISMHIYTNRDKDYINKYFK